VRRARREDSEGFLKLLIDLANFEHLEPPDARARGRIIQDVFESKRLNLLLAFAEGKGDSGSRLVNYESRKVAVGYALFFFTYSSFLGRPTLYLEDLFVSEQYRGQKIGRELFNACIREALKKKCGRMEWAVLTWNQKAIDFYEKAGARRLNDWYYYRLDPNALTGVREQKK
jgi:GNAT superfamily N-acetyltransferase